MKRILMYVLFITLTLSCSVVLTEYAEAAILQIVNQGPFFVTLSPAESSKPGYRKVSEQGGVVPLTLMNSDHKYNTIREFKIDFYAAYFAGDPSGGSVRVDFYSGNDIVATENFEILHRMNDPMKLKDNRALQQYTAKIETALTNKRITKIEMFVHPGYWAVYINNFKISMVFDE
ncbi:MAG: hypothetical protein HQL04_07040 [Nitrospirae bacterium]|nr:hypothetical protein [Nitrospirota bacterium]